MSFTAGKKAGELFGDLFGAKPKPKAKEVPNTKKAEPKKAEEPKKSEPKKVEEPKKSSVGDLKKGGAIGAVGAVGGYLATTLGGSLMDTVGATMKAGMRRHNINLDPHTIVSYNGTQLRDFRFTFNLVPMSAANANAIVLGMLALKQVATGTQIGIGKTGILVGQEYCFSFEFGSSDPAKSNRLRDVMGLLLQVKPNETAFSLTNIMTDYIGNYGSKLYGNGLARMISVTVGLREKRPLRMQYNHDQNTSVDTNPTETANEAAVNDKFKE